MRYHITIIEDLESYESDPQYAGALYLSDVSDQDSMKLLTIFAEQGKTLILTPKE